MAGQHEELSCPFCDKGRISCLYFPSAWGEKRTGRSSLGSGKRVTKSSEEWIVQSGCNVCNKSKEEINSELKKLNII